MTNIEIIKMLVNALDTNGVAEEANKQAALALLDNIKVAQKKEPAEVKKEVKPRKSGGGRKSTIDWPKVEALKDAGWTHQAIAEEVGCSTVTIGKHFMKEVKS